MIFFSASGMILCDFRGTKSGKYTRLSLWDVEETLTKQCLAEVRKMFKSLLNSDEFAAVHPKYSSSERNH
jgi:hypothetical protein